MKSNHVLEHFGKFSICFVFEFCIFIAILVTSFCVLENFSERSSPLRASRKVMRFRFLFHSIWGPEEFQKSFQLEPEIQPKAVVRLDFILHFGVFFGTGRSGGFPKALERVSFSGSRAISFF